MRVIQIKARTIQLERRGPFGHKKVVARIPAFGYHLPEVKLEKSARETYIRYLIQDGRINQMDAGKTVSEGVQKIWRMAFETKLKEKVRVWAESYYRNYPHLYDSKDKRLKGYQPEVIAAHFMPVIEVRKGQRGNVDMQGVIAEMAASEDRRRFDDAGAL